DRDRVPFTDAMKLRRHLGYEPGIVVAPAPELRERLGPAAVAAKVRETRLEVGRAAATPGVLRVEPLGLRAPELGPPAPGEPAGVAHVVRMKVRHQHAPHPTTVEVRREDALPERARVVAAYAGVDDGPARAVVEQPQVDVVELKRQRHAQPVDSGC